MLRYRMHPRNVVSLWYMNYLNEYDLYASESLHTLEWQPETENEHGLRVGPVLITRQ